MGLLASKFFSQYFGKKSIRILMLGLDGAGKTTILSKLKPRKVVSSDTTTEVNVETVEYKNDKFTVSDVAGKGDDRIFWKHYSRNVQGIIFVVDTSDRERVDIAKEELQHERMCENAGMSGFISKPLQGDKIESLLQKIKERNK